MDSRIPKPDRINVGNQKQTKLGTAVKENIANKVKKLTTTQICNAMELAQPRAAPLATRSRTALNIKTTLNTKPSTSKPAVSKPPTTAAVARKPVVIKPVTRVGATGGITKRVEKVPESKAKPVAAKRIPPYDYKARFNDLKEKHDALKLKHEDLRQQIQTFDDLPEQFDQCKEELAKATVECSELKAEREIFRTENSELKATNSQLEKKIRQLAEKVQHFESYCPQLETELSTLKDTFESTKQENIRFKDTVQSLNNELGLCADQLFTTNIERKNLHNEVSSISYPWLDLSKNFSFISDHGPSWKYSRILSCSSPATFRNAKTSLPMELFG